MKSKCSHALSAVPRTGTLYLEYEKTIFRNRRGNTGLFGGPRASIILTSDVESSYGCNPLQTVRTKNACGNLFQVWMWAFIVAHKESRNGTPLGVIFEYPT